jgi:hypothetical protein
VTDARYVPAQKVPKTPRAGRSPHSNLSENMVSIKLMTLAISGDVHDVETDAFIAPKNK